MGGKHNKCCCCPSCTEVSECCRCACTRLCVDLTPTVAVDADGEPCPSYHVELELAYNAILGLKAYEGTINGIDVLYWIETIDGTCWFQLRSTVLGYPAGYEMQWPIGSDAYDLTCTTLVTEVPYSTGPYCETFLLTTGCAEKLTPTHCTGCNCACECLCVTYIKGSCVVGAKACWDGYGAWRATVQCRTYDDPVDIVISLVTAGSLCDQYSDPYCDPDDRSCRLILNFSGVDVEDEGTVPGCPDIAASWVIPGDYGDDDDVTISVRCAICGEDCELPPIQGCCPDSAPPPTLHVTMEVRLLVTQQGPYGGEALIANYDCATYVFAMDLTSDPSDAARTWESDWTALSNCGCVPAADDLNLPMGFVTTNFRASLLCGHLEGAPVTLSITGDGSPCSATTGGPSTDQDIITIYNCDPFFGRLVVEAVPPGQRWPAVGWRTWCCGGQYLIDLGVAPAGVEYFYSTRLIFTITE